jgi:hypothetical protein
LAGQADPGPTPEAVRDAARRSRRMRPAQAPPPLEPSRRRALVVAAVAVGVVGVLVAVAATAAALTGPRGGRAGRVAELVKVPTAAQLAMTVRRDAVEVVNRSARAVTWRATTDVEWLRILPDQGRVESGDTVVLTTRVQPSSPEGALRATVTVSGDDGSAAAAVYETTIERPPDLATTTEGCVVRAAVEDASGIDSVFVRWTDGASESRVTMTGPSPYTATLPAAKPLRWRVIAKDTRGNQSRSPENPLTC